LLAFLSKPADNDLNLAADFSKRIEGRSGKSAPTVL